MKSLKVLVACEESQAVCKAFRELGHEAYSCDIQQCSGGHPEWHIQGDALLYMGGNPMFSTQDGVIHSVSGVWDLLIAHPPCTYLCSAGQPWTNIERYGDKAIDRLKKREDAAIFFMEFVNPVWIKHRAIENPVGIMSKRYRKADQYIQPWQFGHYTSKKTGLWLFNLPLLKPTDIVEPKTSFAWDNMYDQNGKCLKWCSEEIKKERSKTFPGIAKAMAEQWSEYILRTDYGETL